MKGVARQSCQKLSTLFAGRHGTTHGETIAFLYQRHKVQIVACRCSLNAEADIGLTASYGGGDCLVGEFFVGLAVDLVGA
jgi:hypothetical protein